MAISVNDVTDIEITLYRLGIKFVHVAPDETRAAEAAQLFLKYNEDHDQDEDAFVFQTIDEIRKTYSSWRKPEAVVIQDPVDLSRDEEKLATRLIGDRGVVIRVGKLW